jgi:Flp pilus assembly protein TadG
VANGLKLWKMLRSGLARTAGAEAAAIVEFAVSLPLLIVLVVGIYDFGGAFNMKQELTNAVREGARYGSTQPTNDLCTSCTAPPTIEAIHKMVDSYLSAENINLCGLSTATGNNGGSSGFTWTFNASTGCGAKPLQLIIQRDFPGPGTTTNGCYATAQSTYVLCTQVTIIYPYQWHFNNVIGLLIPNGQLNLLEITAKATSANTD